MIKARREYWFAQFGGWFLLSMLLFISSVGYTDVKENKALTNEQIINAIIGTSIFFLCGFILSHLTRKIFISLNWLNLKFGPLIPRALLLTAVCAIIMSSALHTKRYITEEDFHFVWGNFFINAFTMSLFFFMWNSVYLSYHFFQRSREKELNLVQLTASHNEIELKNLRSQLNPHFLFNSLNSIRALVEIDPKEAKNGITKLSSLLRKSLVLGKEQLLTLEEEIGIVNDYIDLEKVRFEERVQVFQEHDPQLSTFLVPPFMLQTIVENAFKHGVSQRIEGGKVWFITRKVDNQIQLMVINEGSLSPNIENGVGIENTQRRLELQYKGKATFKLNSEENCVVALISIEI